MANGVILTIEPGVTVRFATESGLICYGTLNAVGTPIETITFTSNQNPGTSGDWNGIKLSGSGANGSQISYCDIGYAKQAVYLENVSNVVIISNSIHHNKGDNGIAGSGQPGKIGCGIYLYSSTNTIISTNAISNNTGGVGGMGVRWSTGGRGSIGCGICLFSSFNNTIWAWLLLDDSQNRPPPSFWV